MSIFGFEMDVSKVSFETWEKLVRSGAAILVVIALTLILLKTVRVLSRRLIKLVARTQIDPEAKKRAETLGVVVRHLATVLIFGVSTMMILSELGLEIGPILAAAGVAGVAIGFGAQNLIKDVINGFFILLEDQIRVGDVVEIAGKSGLVERVNLKMTVLRDLSGNVHFIPNGHIDTVTNMTKEYSRYVFDIGVTYEEDIDKVIGVMTDLDEEMRSDPEFKDDILQPMEILGLDKFDTSSVVIRARITTKPIQQWRVGREFNRRLKKKFDEQNISFPFPTRTVYNIDADSGKKGK